MRVVVSDTGPLHYLVLIGEIELLPGLFGMIYVPEIVQDELRHARAPSSVRQWLATDPVWLKPSPTASVRALPLPKLGDGERAAIALAESLHADIILMDDRQGATAPRELGVTVIGTLGILDLAARRGLIDLADTFRRLTATNFRVRSELLDELLARHGT